MSIQAVAWVLEHSQSRGIARLVLISLANHHNGGTGQCNPGQRRIADEAGISKSTALRAVRRLVEIGELEVLDPGDNRRAAKYRLPWAVDKSQSGGPQWTAEVHPGRTAEVHPGRTRTVSNRNEPEGYASLLPRRCDRGCWSGWLTDDDGNKIRCECSA